MKSTETEEYELIVDDEFAASATGPNAIDEIMHYLMVYVQDGGHAEVYRVTRERINMNDVPGFAERFGSLPSPPKDGE